MADSRVDHKRQPCGSEVVVGVARVLSEGVQQAPGIYRHAGRHERHMQHRTRGDHVRSHDRSGFGDEPRIGRPIGGQRLQ